MPSKTKDSEIAQAIFTVNRHAKTAPDNQFLYALKNKPLNLIIQKNGPKKLALPFTKNPRKSQQQSSVLVKCGNYYFHMLPKKEDFQSLEHFGDLDESYRNPPSRMNLKHAKELLQNYTGLEPPEKKPAISAFSKRYEPKEMNRFYSPKKSYFD